MTRYVIEGEWTGYTSAQRQIVHREILTKKRAAMLGHLKVIVYTDGTSLLLSIRELAPREEVKENLGYKSLIAQAEKHGGSRVLVADLPD